MLDVLKSLLLGAGVIVGAGLVVYAVGWSTLKLTIGVDSEDTPSKVVLLGFVTTFLGTSLLAALYFVGEALRHKMGGF